MFGNVLIKRTDGSEIPTPLLANAATAIRFKQIFGVDLLSKFANAQTETENGTKYEIDFIPELAYIMAMQAKQDRTALDKLNRTSFIDWLEQYDSFAFENAAEEIINVYVSNLPGSSEAKKNTGRQKGK